MLTLCAVLPATLLPCVCCRVFVPALPATHRLIEALVDAAAQQGCYKVILDCSEANQAFYEKCGLIRKEVQMVSQHTGGAVVLVLG